MLFYIDYLDHITSGNKKLSFKLLEQRLRFDLLIFSGDTLCMSVPACVKLEDTTKLLMELDDFWSSGKILLQLDKKHNGKPANYWCLCKCSLFRQGKRHRFSLSRRSD